MSETLWILSEERPKINAIKFVLEKFCKVQDLPYRDTQIRINPLGDENGNFTFWYEVEGFSSPNVEKVVLRIISGSSSFIDFLVFFQKDQPVAGDRPLFMVEETKTDDEESRNTGVYQRCSKFVYAEQHYPDVDLSMFYNLQVPQRSSQTETNIFGTRCLRTLGVQVEGKILDEKINKPFSSVEELIKFKASMRQPPAGNIPIEISYASNKLTISGKLFKDDGLKHDPNIGALSLIGATARKLGWTGPIVITKHGLEQKHVLPNNKFVRIANSIGLQLENIELPKSEIIKPYWNYNSTGEKLGTILVHLVVENFSKGFSIFENHAGSEKGYFIDQSGTPVTLAKYVPESVPRKSIDIPDLILLDKNRKQIINLEGKTYENMLLGIKTLENYDDIEELYIEKYYPGYEITRSVVIFGSHEKEIGHNEVSFLLNEDGEMIVSENASELIKESFLNLRRYWQEQL